MWIDTAAANQPATMKKMMLKGFSWSRYMPEPLHEASFLTFLIARHDFAALAELEKIAGLGDEDEIRRRLEEVMKKWEMI